MHVLVLAEGFSDETGLKKFEKDWNGRSYANGKSRLHVREMKLYTLGLEESGREEFLKDLKGLTYGGQKFEGNDGKNDTPNWKGLMKWIRRFSRMFGVKPIDDSKIEATRIWNSDNPLACNAHFLLIGEIKDHYKDGVEQV